MSLLEAALPPVTPGDAFHQQRKKKKKVLPPLQLSAPVVNPCVLLPINMNKQSGVFFPSFSSPLTFLAESIQFLLCSPKCRSVGALNSPSGWLTSGTQTRGGIGKINKLKKKGQKRAGINYVRSTGGCCSHMSYFVVIVIIKCQTGGILSHHCPTESPA